MLSIFQTKSSDAIPQMTIMGSRKAPLSAKPSKIFGTAELKTKAVAKPKAFGFGSKLPPIAQNIVKSAGGALVKAGSNALATKTKATKQYALGGGSSSYMKSAAPTKDKARLKMSASQPARLLTSPKNLTGKSLGIPQNLLHPRYPKGAAMGMGGKFMKKGSNDYVKAVLGNITSAVSQGKISNVQGLAAARQIVGRGKPMTAGTSNIATTGNKGLPPQQNRVIGALPRAKMSVGSVGGNLGFTAKPPSPSKAKSFIDNAKNAIVTKFNQAKAQRIAANKQQQAADRQRRLAQKKLQQRTQQTQLRERANQKIHDARRKAKQVAENAKRFNVTEDKLGRTTYSFK